MSIDNALSVKVEKRSFINSVHARMVSVYVDSTIALPLVVTALAEEKTLWKNREIPSFDFLDESV